MRDRSSSRGSDAEGERAAASPGKRTVTEALSVQRQASASAEATPRAPSSVGDAFFFAPVQAAEGALDGDRVHHHASAGVAGASSALPHADAIQASFGRHDVSGVRAQVGGAAADAATAMGATAYATGDRIGFAGSPDLHTAAHEAAHVVQQRGGVHLKGGVGAVGDRYEQHADAVADRVVRGESAETLLDELAGGGGGGGGAAVQRRMGVEIEVGRRVVKSDDAKVPGDKKLLDHDLFTLVSDSRQGESNLEFVMKVFDQLAGDEAAALAALTTRLDAIRALYDLIYADDNDHRLDALPGVGAGDDDIYTPMPKDPAAAGGATWGDAKLRPKRQPADADADAAAVLPDDDNGGRRGELFCHFTVGFPIDKMYQAMTWLAGADAAPAPAAAAAAAAAAPVPRLYSQRESATDAIAVADAVDALGWAQALTGAQRTELKGAIVLFTTQIAAFMVKVRGGPDGGQKPGQVKNMTPTLSRVDLSDIHLALSAPVRAAMVANAAEVIDTITAGINTVDDFHRDDTRQVAPLAAVRLRDYWNSGIAGGANVSQERVFGGMNVTGVDASHGMNLIPIELRSFRKHYMSWPELRASATDLLRESRAMLLPPAAAAAAPQAAAAGGGGQAVVVAADGGAQLQQPVIAAAPPPAAVDAGPPAAGQHGAAAAAELAAEPVAADAQAGHAGAAAPALDPAAAHAALLAALFQNPVPGYPAVADGGANKFRRIG